MHTPFPHVLSSKKELSEKKLRIVSDVDLSKSKEVYDYDCQKHNKETNMVDTGYNKYELELIPTSRPARGDWSKWDIHPNYYEGIGSYKGQVWGSSINK